MQQTLSTVEPFSSTPSTATPEVIELDSEQLALVVGGMGPGAGWTDMVAGPGGGW